MKKDDQQGRNVKKNHDKKENKEEQKYQASLKVRNLLSEIASFDSCPHIISNNKNLSWDEKQILWCIYLHTRDPKKMPAHMNWDSCRPSQETLAAFCNRTRNRIRPFIDSLLKKGYIEELKRYVGKRPLPSMFFITELIFLDLLENPHHLKRIARDQIYELSILAAKMICPELIVANATVPLSRMRQSRLSQMRHDLDPRDLDRMNLECSDFSNEKPDTHTGRKTVDKKQKWKRKGEGVEGEGKNSKSGTVSKNASHQGTGKIPPSPFRTKTVGNGKLDSRKLLVGASESNQGEKGMQWGKNAGKGALTKNKGIDNTEGLALSKFKQTGRKDKPEKAKTPWPSRAKKPSTKVRDFQRYFQDKTGSREECRPYEYGLVEQLVKELGFDMSRALVDYAVENWSQLRGQDSALHIDANINQLLLKSRYQKWISKIKQTETSKAMEQNLPKNPIKQVKLVFPSKPKLHAVK